MEEPTEDLQVKVTGNTDGWELSEMMSSNADLSNPELSMGRCSLVK